MSFRVVRSLHGAVGLANTSLLTGLNSYLEMCGLSLCVRIYLIVGEGQEINNW